MKKLLGLKIKRRDHIQFDYSFHEIIVPDKIPENFDSRKKWHTCNSIKSIKDQSNCGSCWVCKLYFYFF